jgi:membrane-bound ClpP family serine protease
MLDFTTATVVKRGYSGKPRVCIEGIIWEVNSIDNELIHRGETISITESDMDMLKKYVVFNFLLNKEAS